MIGSDGVTKNSQAAGRLNSCNGSRLEREVFKEGRLLDVGAFTIPSVGLAWFAGDFIPSGVLLGKIAVELLKDRRLKSGFHSLADLFAGGPEIL